jgi:hypothetical protein
MSDDSATSRLRNLGESDRRYIEEVRRAAGRLAVREAGPQAARDALADVEDLSDIDIEVPTDSPDVVPKYLKRLVKRVVRWYIRYVAAQVTALGQALSRLGSELIDRIDGLEASTNKLDARLEDLTARVERLEDTQLRAPSREP